MESTKISGSIHSCTFHVWEEGMARHCWWWGGLGNFKWKVIVLCCLIIWRKPLERLVANLRIARNSLSKVFKSYLLPVLSRIKLFEILIFHYGIARWPLKGRSEMTEIWKSAFVLGKKPFVLVILFWAWRLRTPKLPSISLIVVIRIVENGI